MKRLRIDPPPTGDVRMARIEKRVMEAAARGGERAPARPRARTWQAIAVGALACACAMIGWTLQSRLRARSAAAREAAAADRAVDQTRERAFRAAEELEARDLTAALAEYRAVARGGGVWAARALYNLAKLEAASGRPDLGIATADEYLMRFPAGAHAEAMAWMRAELFGATGWNQQAEAAARRYLERYPDGVYVSAAQKYALPH